MFQLSIICFNISLYETIFGFFLSLSFSFSSFVCSVIEMKRDRKILWSREEEKNETYSHKKHHTLYGNWPFFFWPFGYTAHQLPLMYTNFIDDKTVVKPQVFFALVLHDYFTSTIFFHAINYIKLHLEYMNYCDCSVWVHTKLNSKITTKIRNAFMVEISMDEKYINEYWLVPMSFISRFHNRYSILSDSRLWK